MRSRPDGRGREAGPAVSERGPQNLPEENPELAGRLAQISFVLLELKAFSEAESILRECLAIREKLEPDRWSTFRGEIVTAAGQSWARKSMPWPSRS